MEVLVKLLEEFLWISGVISGKKSRGILNEIFEVFPRRIPGIISRGALERSIWEIPRGIPDENSGGVSAEMPGEIPRKLLKRKTRGRKQILM